MPESIARPAGTKAMPVSTVQKAPPKGIQFGIMAATSWTAVKCPKPKTTEHNPNVQRAMRVDAWDSEVAETPWRPLPEAKTISAAITRITC